ncbi:hypothetical protein AVEN_51574-1 [Araneus ventricosus]|uniref:Uncharacterized protein n=1 Tax=Araneus ventricosus TaxID=182803 RepID=A0A4Y2RHC7_ARAVE|nr:hypothetical protein AVEN_51574-1 [Araneus ventricosus]
MFSISPTYQTKSVLKPLSTLSSTIAYGSAKASSQKCINIRFENGDNSCLRDTREMDNTSIILKAIAHFTRMSHIRASLRVVKHWIAFARDISCITENENVSNSFYAAIPSEEQVTFRTRYKSDQARFSHMSGYQ